MTLSHLSGSWGKGTMTRPGQSYHYDSTCLGRNEPHLLWTQAPSSHKEQTGPASSDCVQKDPRLPASPAHSQAPLGT